MIPMIDLLMVTISFLLITAVWVQSSRLEANAQVPGPTSQPPCEGAECKEEARLHVEAQGAEKFLLSWRRGREVLRQVEVPREHGKTFHGLAAAIEKEWKAEGAHRDPADKGRDRAVVHAANDLPYKEIVAMMDAVSKPKRLFTIGGAQAVTAAFDVTFATD
jgi:biopolymer transport protein ExbD